MNGIIIVDKPSGWTSHDVVAKLRGALKVKRIGHGGTLDPIATGVLPVFAGRATRAVEFCENSDKEYIAGLKLGIVTDTQDITGNVLNSAGSAVTASELSDILPRFLGAQKQIPPMYSAIKIDGKKLYELARRGVDIQRPARNIHISGIELLESRDSEFQLKIACSKGTYIRTLCHDIGAALGCGGIMSSLRRTRAGAFKIDAAHTLDEILDAISSGGAGHLVLPVDSLFSAYPAITLGDEQARKCRNGALCADSCSRDGIYRFYEPNGNFLLLGEIKNGTGRIIKSFYEV